MGDNDDYHDGFNNNVTSSAWGSPEYRRGEAERAHWDAIRQADGASIARSPQPDPSGASPQSTPRAFSGPNAYGGGGSLSRGGLLLVIGLALGAFCLSTTGGAFRRKSPVTEHQAIKPLSVESLPSIEEVLEKTKVADPVETLARQAAAFNLIAWAIFSHAKAGAYGGLTPAERAAYTPYAYQVPRLAMEGKELIRRRGAPTTGPNSPEEQWSRLTKRYDLIAFDLWPALR